MTKRLISKLSVEINFRDIEEMGLCTIDDEERFPRYFTIDIKNGLAYNDILMTLAHELTHVKQFARRELTNFDTHNTRAKFNGKTFNTEKTSYWLFPHEIEAMGYETALFTLYSKEFLNEKA